MFIPSFNTPPPPPKSCKRQEEGQMSAITTKMSHGHGGMTLTWCQKRSLLSIKVEMVTFGNQCKMFVCLVLFFCNVSVSHFLYCPFYRSSAGGGKKGEDTVCICFMCVCLRGRSPFKSIAKDICTALRKSI